MSEQLASEWDVVEGSYDALREAFSSAARGSPQRISASELPQVFYKTGMMAAMVSEETVAFLKGALLEVGCSDTNEIGLEQLEPLFHAVVDFQACKGCSDEEWHGRFPKANGVLDAVAGTTPLLQAVSANDETAVRGLLRLGALVDWPAYEGSTPLYAACEQGRAGLVKLLLGARAETDATVGRLGSTPLGIASLKGHLAVVEALAAAGAALDLPSKDGSTALYTATRGLQLEVVKVLLAAGADHSKATNKGLSPLHRACALGHTELIQALLGAGADPEQMDVAGSAPLHTCCAHGQAEAVGMLLEAQADLDARDFSGATPLLRAVLAGRFGTAAVLLRRGASANTPAFSGASPLSNPVPIP
jgi:ankyrin repeat protein